MVKCKKCPPRNESEQPFLFLEAALDVDMETSLKEFLKKEKLPLCNICNVIYLIKTFLIFQVERGLHQTKSSISTATNTFGKLK